MAKKPANSNNSSKKPMAKSAPARAPIAASSMRNTPIPRQPAKQQPSMSIRREPAQADIAKRAYEIWQSGKGGSQMENWLRAERELRGGSGGTGR